MIQRLITWFRGKEKLDFYTCRCQHCEQKIRYKPEKAGSLSLCPRCRRSIKLPIETTDVGRVGHAAAGHRLVQKQEQN